MIYFYIKLILNVSFSDEYEKISPNHTLNSTVNNSFSLAESFLDSSVNFVDEKTLPNTIETFVLLPNPTDEVFNGIPDQNKLESFRSYLKRLPDEEYLKYLVFTTLKTSALSEKSQESKDIAKALYSDCYNYGKETNQNSRITQFFLIQLGLLKSEDHHIPTYDVKACRQVMHELIKEDSSAIPSEPKNTFKLFLEQLA